MSAQDQIMSCEIAVELLPWLLNGALEGAERQALRRHLASCTSCRRELDEAAQVSRLLTWHVPSLALAQYAQELAPSELDRERIERHLALCPSCREELAGAMAGDRVVDFAAARERRSARRRPVGGGEARPAAAGRRLAMAAAVGAMLIGGGLMWRAGKHEPVQTASAVVARATDDVDGARRALSTTPAPDRIDPFTDGFESGDTDFWSSTSP